MFFSESTSLVQRHISAIILILSLLFTLGTGYSAPTAAGTSILNQATLSYNESESTVDVSTKSNTVDVVVQSVEALVLTTDNSIRVPSGTAVALPHRLTNIGNVATTAVLTAANASGDDYDLQGLKIIRDVNSNGRLDSGEPVVGQTPIDLAIGASIDLLVAGTVPISVTVSQTARVNLNATSTKGVTVSNTDNIQSSQGLALQVALSASVSSASPGETVIYGVSASNLGLVPGGGISVIVDGSNQTLLVLRDPIPVNTTFVSANAPSTGTLLYHLIGNATHTYTTVRPADLTRIDAIAVGFPTMAPQGELAFTYTVRLNDNASGDIYNQARLYFNNPVTSQDENVRSNTLQLRVPETMPSIHYYLKEDFDNVAYGTTVGRPLYVQVDAARCNLNSAIAETLRVTIHSRKSGDDETYEALETGPNTGVFRIDTPVPTRDSRIYGEDRDGWLETTALDVLIATAECNGVTVSTTILVDPRGIVFDSKTNAVIAGAQVTLIDVTGQGNGGNAGGPARVFQFDNVTPAPSTVITSADGAFTFPMVAPSTYKLAIIPPANYAYPSAVAVGDLPSGRVIDPAGSYGGNFIVSVATGTVTIDVPMDPNAAPTGGLFVEKIASRRQAEIGDFVDYQVKVRNSSGNAINNISLVDLLPSYFVYVRGTTRREGAAIDEPQVTATRLTFNLGNMANGDQITISYRLRIAVGAKTGEAKNRASASGTSGTATIGSNMASASVRVSGGVLNSKGILLGRVFVDLNKNGVVNDGEPGIPGVRLYLEDGTYVITDGNGLYDVYGLDSQTHVVKVDNTTLPAGSKLAPITSAHANKGDSAFVDLKSGELHKTNFAEISATPAILAEIKKRGDQIAKFGEVDLAISRDIASDLQETGTSDTRSLPASGIVNEPGVRTATSGGSRFESSKTAVRNVAPTSQVQSSADPFVPTPELSAGNSNLPELPVAETAAPNKDADSLPDDITSELGFADFMEGDRMAFDQANVRVKGPLDGKFVLKVNGQAVDGSRLGTKITLPNAGIAVWEFVGVRFKTGSNELEVSDSTTNNTAKISVLVPGSTGKIEVTVSKASVFADAKTLVPVKVRLMDAQGTQISARTPLTLESTKGRWQVADLNPSEPGIQVFIEGGSAQFNLIAPSEPGDSTIRVSSGVLLVENKVSFTPELRPLVAAGLVDAKINLFNFKPRSAKAIATSQFEDELRGISLGNTAGARAAMFAKGQIQGKYLLTLRYDSQGKKDERLFRDIQPDEYYPVYGDDAVKGYDAQSTSRLYVRVDKEKSYLLMGDYTTTGSNEARSLGEYNRSFNGVRAHHEDDKLSANFWATRDNSRQLVDELRGRGTSGPYALRSTDLVEQSEKVEIIVRDRNQPSVILSVTPQSRFFDYQYDSRTGGILFNRPVPSVDSELNPIFVRVSYEINQGGPKFNVAGVDAQYKLAKNLEVGAAMVRDDNPQNKSNLRSVNATFRINEGTTLIGEWAQTKTDALGTGSAKRLELLHQSDKLTARAFIGESDNSFDNAASILSAGRKEASLKADYKVTSKDTLKAEAIRTEDAQNGNKREGGQISLEHTFANDVRLEVGMRHAKESQQDGAPAGTDPVDFTSARVKLTAPVPSQPRANVFAEYEQDIKDSSKKVFALGGNYQLNDRSRLYIRHELLSSLSGRYALNDSQDSHATLIGIDTDYAPNAHVFSEYRINNGISGREAEAAIGLRNGWELSKGLRVNTTFEKIRGEGDNNSTAITGAIEYTAQDNLKSSLRLESRSGTGGRTLMAIAGAAYKMNDDMTVLAKAVMHSGSGGSAARAGLYDRLLLGWAYRQAKNDRLNALAKFEWRRGAPGDARFGDILDKARILSLDANYQAGKRITISGHYAAKWSNSRNDDLSSTYFSQLASGRITRELDRRSNVSLLASASRGSVGNGIGFGVEYNYMVRDNMWLGLGYNHSSIDDVDLLESDAPGTGFYMRLRWKFDENLFGNNLSGTEGFAPTVEQPQMPLPIATP